MPVGRSPPPLKTITENLENAAEHSASQNISTSSSTALQAINPLSWSMQCNTPTLNANNNSFANSNLKFQATTTTSLPTVSTQTLTTMTVTTTTNAITSPIASIRDAKILTHTNPSDEHTRILLMGEGDDTNANTPMGEQDKIIYSGSANKSNSGISKVAFKPSSLNNTHINTDNQKNFETTNLTSKGAVPKKFQTGLDRYITIANKRKLSPKSSKNSPNPKQIKKVSPTLNIKKHDTENINTDRHNRFAPLSENNHEIEEVPAVVEQKPPPIFLRETNSNNLVNSISLIVGKGNFYVVSLRRGNINETKIVTHTEKNYRNVIKYLDSNKKNYYSYQLKCDKGLTVVLKGIDSDVSVDDIKEALNEEGFKAKSIFNIINKNKIPQPMFKVEIEYEPKKLNPNESHPIYNLRYLLSRRIAVEEPHKRRAPPQCVNCTNMGTQSGIANCCQFV